MRIVYEAKEVPKSAPVDEMFVADPLKAAPGFPADSFEWLLTSAEPEVMARIWTQCDSLPGYEHSWVRTIESPCRVGHSACFDLSIVVCGHLSRLAENAAVARERTQHRDTTILFVPNEAPILGERDFGVLTVRAPSMNPVVDLATLEHAVLAPVLSEGLACVDWADLLTVFAEGTDAILARGAGRSPSQAIDSLLAAVLPVRTQWFGACFSMSSDRPYARHIHLLSKMLSCLVRDDGLVLTALPVRNVVGSLISMLALTHPSGRLSMQVTDDHVRR